MGRGVTSRGGGDLGQKKRKKEAVLGRSVSVPKICNEMLSVYSCIMDKKIQAK